MNPMRYHCATPRLNYPSVDPKKSTLFGFVFDSVALAIGLGFRTQCTNPKGFCTWQTRLLISAHPGLDVFWNFDLS
jgi:hypothetical protein